MTLVVLVAFYVGLIAVAHYFAKWTGRRFKSSWFPILFLMAIVGTVGGCTWANLTWLKTYPDYGDPE